MRLSTAAPLLLILGLTACGGPSTPTAPPREVSAPPPAVSTLGGWTLDLAADLSVVSLEPIRATAAYADGFWIDATQFLTGPACGDCLAVLDASRSLDDEVVMTFGVRHPFAPGTFALPSSGANRLDLHAFDAQLLIAGDLGNTTATLDGATVTLPSRLVVDPAGYSDLLTATVPLALPGLTSTAWPYVTVNEDRTDGNWAASNPGGFADLENPTGRNVFPMGVAVETPVTLGLTPADGQVRLAVFLAVSYGKSIDSRNDRLNARYMSPEFNARAPWRVELEVPDLSNDLEEGVPASTAVINARVFHWHQGAIVDPGLNTLDAISTGNDIGLVQVAIPGVMVAPLDLGAPLSGTGPGDDPLLYSAVFTNSANAPAGDYLATGKVKSVRDLGSGRVIDQATLLANGQLELNPLSECATYQTVGVSVEAVVGPVLQGIAISPLSRPIIAQGAGEAIGFTAIGTYDIGGPQDITTTVTWLSSATDVGTFSSNTLTGIGMGVTQVTATLSSINSPPTTVIVKPVEFLTLPGTTFAFERPDANQITGELYLACSVPANSVRTYADDGTFLPAKSWTVTGAQLNGQPHDIAVDEVGNRVFVITGNNIGGAGNNVAVYSLTGTPVTGYRVTLTPPDDIPGVEFLDAGAGQTWFLHHSTTTFDAMQFNPVTGAMLGGFNHPDLNACSRGTDVYNGLFYVASICGGFSNKAVVIADPATSTVLVAGGNKPPLTGQNDGLGVDRDGFIHVAWGAFSPNPLLIQVYEYTAPSTLSSLYSYTASTPATFVRGFGISRPNNVPVVISNGPNTLTWFR